jgi:hypothetical protein
MIFNDIFSMIYSLLRYHIFKMVVRSVVKIQNHFKNMIPKERMSYSNMIFNDIISPFVVTVSNIDK